MPCVMDNAIDWRHIKLCAAGMNDAVLQAWVMQCDAGMEMTAPWTGFFSTAAQFKACISTSISLLKGLSCQCNLYFHFIRLHQCLLKPCTLLFRIWCAVLVALCARSCWFILWRVRQFPGHRSSRCAYLSAKTRHKADNIAALHVTNTQVKIKTVIMLHS